MGRTADNDVYRDACSLITCSQSRKIRRRENLCLSSIRNQYLCTIASFLLPTKTTHAKTASYGLDTSLPFFAVAFGSVFCSVQLKSEISAYPPSNSPWHQTMKFTGRPLLLLPPVTDAPLMLAISSQVSRPPIHCSRAACPEQIDTSIMQVLITVCYRFPYDESHLLHL